ncbi:hypothetical protein HBB16_20810 [Pseudonocardia sp. MCCB 268]|nr:hypothetical protein [Pseudonocardia cytotoxica]
MTCDDDRSGGGGSGRAGDRRSGRTDRLIFAAAFLVPLSPPWSARSSPADHPCSASRGRCATERDGVEQGGGTARPAA